jgi:hypothetical protein
VAKMFQLNYDLRKKAVEKFIGKIARYFNGTNWLNDSQSWMTLTREVQYPELWRNYIKGRKTKITNQKHWLAEDNFILASSKRKVRLITCRNANEMKTPTEIIL